MSKVVGVSSTNTINQAVSVARVTPKQHPNNQIYTNSSLLTATPPGPSQLASSRKTYSKKNIVWLNPEQDSTSSTSSTTPAIVASKSPATATKTPARLPSPAKVVATPKVETPKITVQSPVTNRSPSPIKTALTKVAVPIPPAVARSHPLVAVSTKVTTPASPVKVTSPVKTITAEKTKVVTPGLVVPVNNEITVKPITIAELDGNIVPKAKEIIATKTRLIRNKEAAALKEAAVSEAANDKEVKPISTPRPSRKASNIKPKETPVNNGDAKLSEVLPVAEKSDTKLTPKAPVETVKSDEVVPTPAPAQRGRPRKKPLVEEPKPEVVVKPAEVQAPPPVEEPVAVEETVPPPEKPKRGRKPSVTLEEKKVTSTPTATRRTTRGASKDAESSSTPAGPSSNPPSNPETSKDVAEDVKKIVDENVKAASPVKEAPPPKPTVPEKSAVEESTTAEETEADEGRRSKRTPKRKAEEEEAPPAKIPAAEPIVTPVVPVKRPPGRPRKTPRPDPVPVEAKIVKEPEEAPVSSDVSDKLPEPNDNTTPSRKRVGFALDETPDDSEESSKRRRAVRVATPAPAPTGRANRGKLNVKLTPILKPSKETDSPSTPIPIKRGLKLGTSSSTPRTPILQTYSPVDYDEERQELRKSLSSIADLRSPTEYYDIEDADCSFHVRHQTTALSFTPRGAEGSYACQKCGFRTSRLNNLVLHHKDQCPVVKNANMLSWENEIKKQSKARTRHVPQVFSNNCSESSGSSNDEDEEPYVAPLVRVKSNESSEKITIENSSVFPSDEEDEPLTAEQRIRKKFGFAAEDIVWLSHHNTHWPAVVVKVHETEKQVSVKLVEAPSTRKG